jgi:hypothetical protein
MDEVDTYPGVGRATELDEEQVLRELYGPPGPDGIFRGDEVGEGQPIAGLVEEDWS